MKLRTIALVITVLFFSMGCYHAKISTGATPSSTTIDENWAQGWAWGLMGPELDTKSKCSRGVASVDTQVSFLNQVVSMLTFGIYAPMQLNVTCAR